MGLGAFSADLEASYNSFVSDAVKESSLSVEFFAQGGAGIAKLVGLIDPDANLNSIAKTIREYCLTFNAETAAPVSHTTASMESLGWRGEDQNLRFYHEFLEELLYIYKDASRMVEKLRDFALSDPTSAYGKLITDDQRRIYQAAYSDELDRKRTIYDKAQECRNDPRESKNIGSLLRQEAIVLPKLPSPPVFTFQHTYYGPKTKVYGDTLNHNSNLRPEDHWGENDNFGGHRLLFVQGTIDFDWDEGDLCYWVDEERSTGRVTRYISTEGTYTSLPEHIREYSFNDVQTVPDSETATVKKILPFKFIVLCGNDSFLPSGACFYYIEVADRFKRKFKRIVFDGNLKAIT